MDKKLDSNYARMLSSNIEQDLEAAPYKAAAVQPPANPSRKLSKLDETDMQDTAGEVGTSS